MARKNFENFAGNNIFEGMISISSVIEGAEKNINDRKIKKIYFDSGRKEKKRRELAYLKKKSIRHGFEIEFRTAEMIDSLSISNTHGGIIAECGERTIPSVDELKVKPNGFYAMIEGIEDPYNFGNAIRTLYAAGADAVILSPRNWMGVAGIVCRASAGASELSELYISDGVYAAEYFKSGNCRVVCADLSPDAVNIYESDLSLPLFLIVGGEKRGISSALLEKCDLKVKLEYGREFKNALSAESAASIIAFEIFRQNKK